MQLAGGGGVGWAVAEGGGSSCGGATGSIGVVGWNGGGRDAAQSAQRCASLPPTPPTTTTPSAQAREEGRTKPHIILRNLTTAPGQVFSLRQGRRDIDAIYSMGLFEDVSMRPQPAEGSSLQHPKVRRRPATSGGGSVGIESCVGGVPA